MNAFGFENSVLIKHWCLKPYFYSLKLYFIVKIIRGWGLFCDTLNSKTLQKLSFGWSQVIL
ncbi:hypothetical protein DDP45_07340 [Helicobacter pylori]|nr:hypothetical protein DDP36_07380 [Helicobacter pylori]RDY79465.1 hypothetical protein DDP45_07340 [Helicobacter pylori]RKU99721.1 hypothetical protein DDP37_07520 [Helicobacter pylori]RKV20018.1 hypothetical protein DD748_07335 [Helicobacter pylori]